MVDRQFVAQMVAAAAARVSPQLKRRRPEVPWGRLADLGEILAHRGETAPPIQDFVSRELPLLDMQLRSVLGSLK